MGLPIEINPDSPQNSQNIAVDTNVIPIDIAPDPIPRRTMIELLGSDQAGVAQSNIAKPFQSPNFKSGVSGWRLNSNGIIEAVGVQIAGNVTISGGSVVAVASGGTGATTLTGILKGNGTGAFTAIVPLAGTKTYYVSDTSGGLVNRKLTFTNGILTSET